MNSIIPNAIGLYDPSDEHDACGVGFVASVDGQPNRRVVDMGIEALKAVWHRGAVDADGKTGDGAGIHLQLAQEFFHEHVRRTGHEPVGKISVGMIFLPRADFGAQEAARTLVENEVLRLGYTIYGWRQVPVDVSILGEKAAATRPEIEQIMIANPDDHEDEKIERDLYIIRRRVEKRAAEAMLTDLYVCSLSCRSIIYKGMFLAEDLTKFYPDLLDERFVSSFAIYHQRYSTNTFPQWKLAQPFRMLAHNGEINTVKGNSNWMQSHEIRMASEAYGEYAEDLKPVIPHGASDSSALDAVFELFVRAGRSAPLAKSIMVPDASPADADMSDSCRALYTYANAIMEPWDGPAAIAATDGRWVVGGMDRNGLRPMRYAITDDGFVVAGSETGMVDLSEARIITRGRLGPGEMLAIDLQEGKIFDNLAIKDYLADEHPYREWVENVRPIDQDLSNLVETAEWEREELRRRLVAAGMTLEDLELLLQPMVEQAKEAVGSMGDDSPLAVLSSHYRPLSHFFRQNFSQVTNPPIDSLREYRVMTLKTRFGNLGNVLDQSSQQVEILTLESPVVSNAMFKRMCEIMGDAIVEIDCTFDPSEGDRALRDAIERIKREAEDAVRQGFSHLILSDQKVSTQRVAIPMILATGGVHAHLVKLGLRTFCSINVRAAECLDPHYFAVLIGTGATTVNPYLALEAVADRHDRGLFGQMSLDEAVQRYKEAVDQGLLKIMSKMGISVISSYRGGYNFEALGLSRSLVSEFFPGMPSRISGIGLTGIQKKAVAQHAKGFTAANVTLPVGGFYRFRRGGENHAYEGQLIHMLQHAVRSGSYKTYKDYSAALHQQHPINLRDLLDFKPAGKPLPIDEVESITEIRKRFVTPAMSLGALSPEAHETLNIAMNRIGAKSDSGEGGEDPANFHPREDGSNPASAIKQVASGRFGVTAEYLNHCREIEIKVAQGAKPGEGGQLPGFKVTDMIARLRHSTPGVTLISPPPHHDIYSIEDLAQLIYDLKQINPTARVTVKLVAASGVGTIAAGVAKAMADVILISGNNGGTGASPQTSIKFAGIPWEMGLAEANQVLTLNNLRHRVLLRTDGSIKTGRDVVMAALLGAEEYGVGTASLVAMGCIMVRQCHSNTCPVGVCTQDPALRDKFVGTPEMVVNLFTFIAEEIREILASLGLRSLEEAVGRSDLLAQVSRGAAHLDDLDMNPLLVQADGSIARTCQLQPGTRNEVPETLDAKIVTDAAPLFNHGEKMELAYSVRNIHRAVGTRTASHIVRRYGMRGLNPGHLTLKLRGSAGQSLGAFCVQGMRIEVDGDANDYVGKGLSGAEIIIRPGRESKIIPHESTIIGNTVLYGATAGFLFASGQAGERFAVRNSGATVVVEGCGSNGCEYMTGGTAVLLGQVGHNFGAGMTGGMAFIYDIDQTFARRVNPESVIWQPLASAHWEKVLRQLIERHVSHTSSPRAMEILDDWDRLKGHFLQVCPKEMVQRLEYPLEDTSLTA
ncbi:MAG: glutamate synthase large subunit [Alphaproteobacteria bacterium]|jgi:glutamate synthase (NADPH/NADH) large chain|nr:glutamate synthase large subunit [Alphaproteobacteria bacterium]